ncbi:MAG: TadE/TadG family type IV pilus assembly protein, partial [Planctomycetota bacterium]
MMRPKAHKRRGATAVEMAVVSTVLFSLLLGGLELSRVTMLRHSAEYASYLGARRGIISGATAADARQSCQDHLDDLGVRNAIITVSPSTIVEST